MEDELLQRVRRLCLAPRELQLPVLLSGVRGEEERRMREETALNGQAAPENEATDIDSLKLPLIAVPKRKQSAKQSEEKVKKLQEEARRLKEQMKMKERGVEKVKQAQERAKARVARTNQLEQQQACRAVEQQQLEAVSAAQQYEETTRRVQQSRRQAKERIRIKREEKKKETPPRSAPGLTTEPTKVHAFRRKTIERLQTSTQHNISSDKNERQSTPERSKDTDAYQKMLERKLRLETTARLHRMKQLEGNQKRQEQEEYEQGLQRHKRKLRELDRVAKGLSKQPSLASLPQPNDPVFETEEPRVEESIPQHSADTPRSGFANNKSAWHQNQDVESSSDSDESLNARQVPSHSDRTEPSSPQTAEPAEVTNHISRSRAKVPVWKQPPVPILPTQCYPYTAIRPAYSRASVTTPGCTTAAAQGSSTHLRSQKISRQKK